MSRAIGEINELILKIQKLQNNPFINLQGWDSVELIQKLLNIRFIIEEDVKYQNEKY